MSNFSKIEIRPYPPISACLLSKNGLKSTKFQWEIGVTCNLRKIRILDSSIISTIKSLKSWGSGQKSPGKTYVQASILWSDIQWNRIALSPAHSDNGLKALLVWKINGPKTSQDFKFNAI